MPIKYSWDAIVLGFSLEAAIAVSLLAKRGWTAAWVGGVPLPTVDVGGHAVNTAPSIVPSRSFTPALNRALDELKLLPHNAPLGPAAAWQLLDDRLRASLPGDASRLADGEGDLEALKSTASEGVAATTIPVQLGFFGERAARKRWQTPPVLTTSGPIGGAAQMVQRIFGLANAAGAADLLAEPHDLPGGMLKLGGMLQRCSVDLKVRVFPTGLQKPLKSLRFGWSEVGCRLASGEDLTARVILFAIPDTDVVTQFPEGMDTTKFRGPDRASMLRLSLAVRTRGLPAALSRFALVQGPRPMWIERQGFDREHDGCTLFWASDGSDVERQKDEAISAFGRIAPFVERHIDATVGPTPLPQFSNGDAPRPWRIARRVLDARGPVIGLRGIEGAALAGAALAQQVMRLSPRKDPLR